MIVLNRSDVVALLPMATCIELMRSAMLGVSAGKTHLPPRSFMPIPGRDGKLGLMPGYADGDGADVFGVKIVSKFTRAPDDPAGTHVGMVALFDADRGLPLALIEGGALTAIRTAATSAMATDALANADAKSLLVLGAGEEAMHHLDSMTLVRPLERINVWARKADRAQAFAEKMQRRLGRAVLAVTDLETAVSEADVICTTTAARDPILKGAWLRPGQHIVLVGSAIAATAEADIEVVARAKFYVDQREAAAIAAGELQRAIAAGAVAADHVRGEIGEVLLGRVKGRAAATDITLYKSLGVLAQDLAAAHYLYQTAKVSGHGTMMDLMQ